MTGFRVQSGNKYTIGIWAATRCYEKTGKTGGGNNYRQMEQ